MRQMTKLVEITLTRKLYVEEGMEFHKVRDTDRKKNQGAQATAACTSAPQGLSLS